MTQSLAQDRPTIDTAVKSFISLVCARSLTASATDDDKRSSENGGAMKGIINTTAHSGASTTQQQALQVARAILQSINAFTFPIHKTVALSMAEKPGTTAEKRQELLEVSIVAQLWNGLIESNKKPSKFLGRRALNHAWKDLDIKSKLPPVESDVGTDEKLVAQAKRQLEWLEEFERYLFHENDGYSANEDNDAALIWDADGGEKELARRRQGRQDAATKRGPATPS